VRPLPLFQGFGIVPNSRAALHPRSKAPLNHRAFLVEQQALGGGIKIGMFDDDYLGGTGSFAIGQARPVDDSRAVVQNEYR